MGSRPIRMARAGFGIGLGRSPILIAGGVSTLLVILAAWDWTRGLTAAELRGIPVIAAAEGPTKRLPADHGGQSVPFQDLELYRLLDGTSDPGRWDSASAMEPVAAESQFAWSAVPHGASDPAEIPPRVRPEGQGP